MATFSANLHFMPWQYTLNGRFVYCMVNPYFLFTFFAWKYFIIHLLSRGQGDDIAWIKKWHELVVRFWKLQNFNVCNRPPLIHHKTLNNSFDKQSRNWPSSLRVQVNLKLFTLNTQWIIVYPKDSIHFVIQTGNYPNKTILSLIHIWRCRRS